MTFSKSSAILKRISSGLDRLSLTVIDHTNQICIELYLKVKEQRKTVPNNEFIKKIRV